MEIKNFDEILKDYKKNNPGNYRNYPCPICGSPILIKYDIESHYGILGYIEECTNKDCNYSWYDVIYTR